MEGIYNFVCFDLYLRGLRLHVLIVELISPCAEVVSRILRWWVCLLNQWYWEILLDWKKESHFLCAVIVLFRQLRNRDAAMRSRERKKIYVKDLEMKSRYMEAECRRLGRLLQCCYAENQMLRISLGSAYGASMAKPESAVLLLGMSFSSCFKLFCLLGVLSFGSIEIMFLQPVAVILESCGHWPALLIFRIRWI